MGIALAAMYFAGAMILVTLVTWITFKVRDRRPARPPIEIDQKWDRDYIGKIRKL